MQLKRFNIFGIIFIVVLEKSVIEIFVKFSVQRSRHVLQYLLNIILIWHIWFQVVQIVKYLTFYCLSSSLTKLEDSNDVMYDNLDSFKISIVWFAFLWIHFTEILHNFKMAGVAKALFYRRFNGKRRYTFLVKNYLIIYIF